MKITTVFHWMDNRKIPEFLKPISLGTVVDINEEDLITLLWDFDVMLRQIDCYYALFLDDKGMAFKRGR
jgi:hypothetical protein